MLLIHANGVGAANWDAMFTWLAARGHRFAPADEVLADDTFRDLPIDPAHWGYGHYHRLAKLRRAAEARSEIAGLLQTQAAGIAAIRRRSAASTRPIRRSRRRAA